MPAKGTKKPQHQQITPANVVLPQPHLNSEPVKVKAPRKRRKKIPV